MGATTLTGRDATEALRAYSELGRLNARFDRNRVAAAVRSSRSRTRLNAALALTKLGVLARSFARPRPRASRRILVSARLSRSRGIGRSGRRGASGDPHPAPYAARTPGEGA